MTESTIQFVMLSEQLPLCNSADLCKVAEHALQQDVVGSDSLEAHIAKMSVANSSGALQRQFHTIVAKKLEKIA
jgi:hypothetical protein